MVKGEGSFRLKIPPTLFGRRCMCETNIDRGSEAGGNYQAEPISSHWGWNEKSKWVGAVEKSP